MKHRVLFVERKYDPLFVSLEKAFRQIAASLSDQFQAEFQQAPYGTRFLQIIPNLLFFRKKPADIYHITGHIYYIAFLFPRRNTVLSVMDVRVLHTANALKRFVLKKLYLDWPVRRMRFVTAISEQVKKDIVLHTGCDEKKVQVLDLPLLDHVRPANEKEFDRECPTILQIGTMANKNIPNLARALKGIKCRLRIIGKISREQTMVLNENSISYSTAVDLTDDELRLEYESADIIAYCSTYEGFGLPIIEAQAMRKAVITSDISPMKETSGGAAVLVDPHDVLCIRKGIQKLISDENYRKELIECGSENAERFLPENVAKQYECLYLEIVNSHHR